MFYFESERLGFRRWTQSDKEVFIRIYGDPTAMKYFPHPLTRAEALARVNLFDQNIARNGYGLWAAILRESNTCIGMIGLKETSVKKSEGFCAGLTWMLDKTFWHQGLATEGAHRCIEWGFTEKDFEEIYAFTTIRNKPSQRVMERLNMKRNGSFLYPEMNTKTLVPHILYKLRREDFIP